MPTVARRLLIALVVIVVLLLAADRIGAYVAERAAGRSLQTSQHLPSRPNVDISGFPFLTQLASRNFDRITVTAKDVPIGQGQQLLEISRLNVVLHTLTVSRSFSQFHADSADATGTVTFDELGRTLGVDVHYAGDGRIAATKSVTVAGRTFSGTITTRPELVDGALSFVGTRVNGANQLASNVVAALTQVFDLDIPLQGIPFHVRVTSVRVGQQGLVVALTGRDLSYAR